MRLVRHVDVTTADKRRRMTTIETPPRLLTVAETAERLRCSKVSVYRRIHSGELPALRLGNETGPLRIPEGGLFACLFPVSRMPRESPVVAPGTGVESSPSIARQSKPQAHAGSGGAVKR